MKVAAAALSGLVLLAGLAHADAQEWRLGAGGLGGVLSAEVQGVGGDSLAFGGSLSLGYGLTNNLDLVASTALLRAPAVEFSGVVLDGQQGDLFADMMAIELAVGARWALGVETWHALERTRPFATIRAGGVLEVLTGQSLLNAQRMESETPAASIRVRPFIGAGLGVEHRFGDHLFLSIAADVGVGASYRHLRTGFELAWAWY